MDSLVQDALKYNANEGNKEAPKLDPAQVRISVIGIGGAGTNTVSRLHRMGIKSANTIAINTDANHLKMIEADRRVLIGKTTTRGMGAGGFPEVGMKAAEASRYELVKMVAENEL